MASKFLPTAHFVALRSPFPFRQAQFGEVFSLKPAPICKLSAGVSSTKILPFFFSSFPLAALSSPQSFLLAQTLAGTVFFLFHFYPTTMVPGHSFLAGNGEYDELAGRGKYFYFSQFLSSRIHFYLFLDCGRTASSKFFDT